MSTRRIARRGTWFGAAGGGAFAAVFATITQSDTYELTEWPLVVLLLGCLLIGPLAHAAEKRHDREIRTAQIYAHAQAPVDDLEIDDIPHGVVADGGELEARVELEAEVARRRQAARLTRDAYDAAAEALQRAEADLLNTSQ